MRASDLRHRICLQERSKAKDELGQIASGWVDVAVLWAQVQPLSGRELMLGQAIHSEVSHTITIRYQKQFSNPAAMAARRIVYNGRIFNIHSAMDVDERHHILELSCSEGLNDG